MALVLQGGLWWGYIVTFLERRLLLEDRGRQRRCIGMLLVIGYLKNRSCTSAFT